MRAPLVDHICQSLIIGLISYFKEIFLCQRGLVKQKGEHYGYGDSHHSMHLNEKAGTETNSELNIIVTLHLQSSCWQRKIYNLLAADNGLFKLKLSPSIKKH